MYETETLERSPETELLIELLFNYTLIIISTFYLWLSVNQIK